MKWKDDIYTQLEPTIKKYALRFANKTNSPSIMYTELYSEGLYQLYRIHERYNPDKGSFIAYFNKSINGCLKNCLRDNRSLKVRRKETQVYGAFYKLKRTTSLADDEIFKQLNITKDEFILIKDSVNANNIISLDTKQATQQYSQNQSDNTSYMSLAINELKETVPENIINALIDHYLNNKPMKKIKEEYNISSTILKSYVNKIKQNCHKYIE